MCGKYFQIYCVHIPRKCIESSYFTHVPPHSKLAAKFLSLHPRQKEITHYPRQHFLENLSSPTAEGGGGTMICLIKIQSEKMKMTWDSRLFIFCMICNFFKCKVRSVPAEVNDK